MRLSRTTENLLRVGVWITLAFIYIPLIVVAIYAFNGGTTFKWPLESLTTEWFPKAFENQGARDALFTSLRVGAAATAIALVLGTLASFAVSRFRFFGRETISFLVVLPIALPGIVTGVALSNTFTQVFGIDLSLFTVVVGHATFCIVLVYNNVIARLRRVSGNLEEASADLGAHTWQTFRHITLPNIQTALVAGGLLAFALSFDEIIVTTFTIGAADQTLPIWIFSNLFRGQQFQLTNVVAVMAVLISTIPVYLAHRLTREEGGAAGARGAKVPEAGPPAAGPPEAEPGRTTAFSGARP
jgi:putative spermidine/putrescine transport system permease protein